ncbi:predicted protein [Streptomyces viridosporus ATCC 14672]|uniref:Predicted protein n=1 Tax=Streptomyces viridosporus (strain ATCC 14672 / DSM 40746 / JCM 4963 / KCTC 9882 / NRRL B-12104 / FH 1290) TaxID=566461 RepID=D5ZTF6_STRV1|nr:predicted protein [Streptomyces viridosporus ATCC 14672]
MHGRRVRPATDTRGRWNDFGRKFQGPGQGREALDQFFGK